MRVVVVGMAMVMVGGLFFLGCSGVSQGLGSNPYEREAQGKVIQIYAQADQRATDDAERALARQATQVAEGKQAAYIATIQAESQAATATAGAYLSAQATSTAQAQATAMSLSVDATKSAQALSVQATQSAQADEDARRAMERESQRLELERDRLNNTIRAIVPWIALSMLMFTSIGIVAVWGWQRARVRYFPPPEGATSGPGWAVVGNQIVTPELTRGPVTSLRLPSGGRMEVSPEQAAIIKDMAMRVEAIRALHLPPAQARAAAERILGGEMFSPASLTPPSVEIVDAEAVEIKDWVSEVSGKLLDRPE